MEIEFLQTIIAGLFLAALIAVFIYSKLYLHL